nr:integrase, catalytic region, zinc finger, CCHC-type, peptidase aspartic, catalytic [Tanacetum cinerariifolium]
MTGDRSQLINFVQKFLGMVKFGNDHVAKIMGYGDYQIGNVTISQVRLNVPVRLILQDVGNDNLDIKVAHMGNDPLLGVPFPKVTPEQSSSTASPQSNVQPNHPMTHHNNKWTKDHPLNYIIGPLSRPVSTRLQLHEQALFCYYDAFRTSVEPKTYKEALTQAC